jgi:hypothetical protein
VPGSEVSGVGRVRPVGGAGPGSCDEEEGGDGTTSRKKASREAAAASKEAATV